MEVKTEGGKWKLILIVIKGNDQFVSGAQFGGGGIVPGHIRLLTRTAKFQNILFKSHGKYIYFF